ncbi:hypothetical protein [Alkalihalophilus marmarensis]|uniref:hypothetical protein n=1 Tax=Alkalihalophilus marmarensis TaxID=521377 RepID=UPI002DBF6C18|nr:hypothetical protein [Alkalihalophilus marmarensis]MEC2074147.1 hypothetical protein [Alkalihalophilus marmarensis]
MIKKLIPLTFLIVMLTVLSPNSTHALSCIEFEEPVINYFDLAIIGTVTNINKKPNDYMYPVEVEVVKSWKQQVPSKMEMDVDYTWGYEFQKDQTYLIYLSVDDDNYINSPCSPVTQVYSEDDSKDLSLEEEFTPVKATKQEEESGKFASKYPPLFLLFSLSAAILIFLLIKKKD